MRSLFRSLAFALLIPVSAQAAPPAYNNTKAVDGAHPMAAPLFDMSELDRFHGKAPSAKPSSKNKAFAPASVTRPQNKATPKKTCHRNAVVFPDYNGRGLDLIAFQQEIDGAPYGVVVDYAPLAQKGFLAIQELGLGTTFHLNKRNELVLQDRSMHPADEATATQAINRMLGHYISATEGRMKNNGISTQPEGWYGPFESPSGGVVEGGTLGPRVYTVYTRPDKTVMVGTYFIDPSTGKREHSSITFTPTMGHSELKPLTLRCMQDMEYERGAAFDALNPETKAPILATRLMLMANALHTLTHPEQDNHPDSPQNTGLFFMRVSPATSLLLGVPAGKDLPLIDANAINPSTGKPFLDPNKTQYSDNRTFKHHLEGLLEGFNATARYEASTFMNSAPSPSYPNPYSTGQGYRSTPPSSTQRRGLTGR